MHRLYIYFLLPATSLLILLTVKSFSTSASAENNARPFNVNEVIGCAPAGDPLEIFKTSTRNMVPLPGWGKHRWQIQTTSDSAQFYFNQGLNLFYSFHMEEAKASFMEAQRHDPKSAMTYWGEAQASGPYINMPGYDFSAPAPIAALIKGKETAKNNFEKDLIAAQQLRFTADKSADMKKMMAAYKNAMALMLQKYPDEKELHVLYADALMMINPRDWFDAKGKEKEGTNEIISLLEDIIKKQPNHPAALHYYIHMVEPSTNPHRARDEADRLLPMMPYVTHMVHMPSHIYVRTGDFSKGVLSNKMAIKGYSEYKKVLKGWEGNRLLYLYHNADMQGTNAMMMGNYNEAKKSFDQNVEQFNPADTSVYNIPQFSNFLQFITVQPYLLNVRFGNWQKLLQTTKPVSRHAYHTYLWHFGQGMAYAKTGKAETALQHLTSMKALQNDASLLTSRPNRNPAISGAKISAIILEGTIHAQQKKWDAAIKEFEAAVAAEDNLRYSEPEDWRIPARQFLGQVYLLKGEHAKAQKLFEADLADHPGNFWALNGLKDALAGQKNKSAVAKLKSRHKEVFKAADVKLYGAVY